MHVAGGVYLELCEVPAWDQVFGSGGRAAAAVSRVSPGTTLHAFAGTHDTLVWESFSRLGLQLQLSPSEESFAFAYFHPLSAPALVPSPSSVPRAAPMVVNGQTVLRFGMLEGEAVVKAATAIYDPQGDRAPFKANGSEASRLALVLNELEAEQMGGIRCAMEDNGAVVAVLKRGVRGATVFSAETEIHIPAYRSSRVFKIGSGDVFSAMFAYWWGEVKRQPGEAADMASRAVARYCETAVLPVVPDELDELDPVPLGEPGSILIEAAVKTSDRRSLIEEARQLLRELGFEVTAPCIGDELTGKHPRAVLWVTDDPEVAAFSERIEPRAVVLAKDDVGRVRAAVGSPVVVVDDFVTALYQVGWQALAR